MKRISILLAAVMVVLAGCRTEPPPDFSLSLSPAALIVPEGASATRTVIVTVNRTSFTGEVSFSLSGAGATGVFSPASTSGTVTMLTLTVDASTPAGSYPLTVTGVSGTKTKSTVLTLTVEAPPTITVAGKVMNVAGQGLSGISVQVVDEDGPKALVVTDGSGAFSVAGVKTPYSVSAVPPPGTAFIPITWEGVTRADPQIVLPLQTGSRICTRAAAMLSGSLSPAVGAGNMARVIFIARGVNLNPFRSSVTQDLFAGDAAYSLPVPFDSILCETTLTGKLVYLERDAANAIVKSAVYDVSVTTGNATVQNITPASTAVSTLSGAVSFPSGLVSARVSPLLKAGGAYAVLDIANVTPAAPGYGIAVPVLSGIEYRTLALTSGPVSWVYSEVLAAGDSANLALPNPNTPISPSGAVSDTTPTFSQTPVTGANLYLSLVVDAAFIPVWIGASSNPEIEMPDLPNPARLSSGGNYSWWALNALSFRGAATVDDLLDGRLVKQPFSSTDAIENPDLISAGTFNFTSVAFNIP